MYPSYQWVFIKLLLVFSMNFVVFCYMQVRQPIHDQQINKWDDATIVTAWGVSVWTVTWSLILSGEFHIDILFPSPLKMSTFYDTNRMLYENLLGSEIYCASEGFTSSISVLVILMTWSTTKSFCIICHSLGHMRAILCKKTQHALRHMEIMRPHIIQQSPKPKWSKPVFNTKELELGIIINKDQWCFFPYKRRLQQQ